MTIPAARCRRLALTLAKALVGAAALVACGGPSDGSEGAAATVVSTTTSNSSTLPSSSTTAVVTTSTPSTSTPTSASRSTTSKGSEFPPQRAVLEHGGRTWAVVLYGSEDPADPLFDNARSVLTSVGYTGGITDCDQGASEVLGLPDGHSYFTLSVYFETEADARAAVTAFAGRGVDGVAGQVETYCLD